MGKNAELGLPTGTMQKVTIAFDVDGTLITNEYEGTQGSKPVANERIRSLLVALAHCKNVKIIVWSGGGELYARQVGAAIGIDKYVDQYAVKSPDLKPDIAIDDIQDTAIGKINLIVREK